MGYNLLINGVYWGYNLLTNLLLTSWDIQVYIEGTKFHAFSWGNLLRIRRVHHDGREFTFLVAGDGKILPKKIDAKGKLLGGSSQLVSG